MNGVRTAVLCLGTQALDITIGQRVGGGGEKAWVQMHDTVLECVYIDIYNA